MSFLDEIPVLENLEVTQKLSKINPKILDFFQRNLLDVQSRSKVVEDWKKWCHKQESRVRSVEVDVKDGILPKTFRASLIDIKVGGKKRCPDDALYNKCQDLRENVARGNTILYMKGDQNETTYDCLIFALKKFTGGMGDEDEDQPENNKVWMDYFIKPVTSTKKIICTMKANGEAAHFSVRYIKDRFVLCVGSKNVHMLVRSYKDVERYTDSRYMVAKTVATSVLDTLSALEMENCALLLNFMSKTHLTAVFEVLQPDYQHVVDLSYLEKSELNFITWTLPYGVHDADSHCAIAPDVALNFAQEVGLKCVSYETINPEMLDERMEKVRKGYNYEGEVFYFVDKNDNVIGLLKKKTTWYVVCRAIREKASAALLSFKKEPSSYSQSERAKKLERRLREIQIWLGFEDECLNKWTKLGVGFLEWIILRSKTNSLGSDNVRGNFPKMWSKYLQEKGLSDDIH